MRRILLLLAVLVAGLGRAGGAELLAVDGRHAVVGDDARSAIALARALPPTPSRASSADPAPRSADPRPDRREGGARLLPDLAPQLAFGGRRAHHHGFAGALALTRAGVHAFHTGTPPPFPLI